MSHKLVISNLHVSIDDKPILRGVIEPPDCPLFARTCSPEAPQGACMVSSEGTCSAWYRHERWAVGPQA